MNEDEQKILGEDRREFILERLRKSQTPLTGKQLAEQTNVSRQVIVQDVSLLKARNEPIMATARGYLYLKENNENTTIKKVVAVSHRPEETGDELYTLVDLGITVLNVTVEHPIYGDLTGSLMLQNRRDVDLFLDQLQDTKASLLSILTDGTHLHTLEADTEEQLNEACQALQNAGYLLGRS
ncbi:MAG TPA: transcription repressor NadR [Bacillales bacterium]|nr:transcription repressor NadR [Bacillales bacterium]HEU5139715.1 transcription repressor NadR [Bacillales bacterium]